MEFKTLLELSNQTGISRQTLYNRAAKNNIEVKGQNPLILTEDEFNLLTHESKPTTLRKKTAKNASPSSDREELMILRNENEALKAQIEQLSQQNQHYVQEAERKDLLMAMQQKFTEEFRTVNQSINALPENLKMIESPDDQTNLETELAIQKESIIQKDKQIENMKDIINELLKSSKKKPKFLGIIPMG